MSETLPLNFPRPFPSCKVFQISHGMPRIVNLNGTFDGAAELESFYCKAFNFKLVILYAIIFFLYSYAMDNYVLGA